MADRPDPIAAARPLSGRLVRVLERLLASVGLLERR